MNFQNILLALVLLVTPHLASAAEFFVSPTGTASGNGTIALPWNLQTALNHPSVVIPGDTIWLRGGTYRGHFISQLRGTAAKPIIVRNYQNERATIDGNPGGRFDRTTVFVRGAFTWFWGLEVMNSDTKRRSNITGSWPTDLKRGHGFEVHGPGTKLINNIVHNNSNGVSIWNGADGAEAYGNLLFHNGWIASDRSHGHGIYTQNQSVLPRRLIDNVVFSNFAYGMHAYGSDAAYLNNMYLEGNTVFNSGSPHGLYYSPNILIGGGRLAENPVVVKNATYYTQGVMRGGQNQLGYSVGCDYLTFTDNYVAHFGQYPIVLENCDGTIERNVLLGFVSQEFRTRYPQNTFGEVAPPTTNIFIRPNQYEPGRALVTIYNWTKRATVAVDLGQAGVSLGSPYRIQSVQDFYGAAALTGTYAGGSVEIPMTGVAVQPIGSGYAATLHTGLLFGSFIVLADAGTTPPDEEPPFPPPCTYGVAPTSVSVPSSATLVTDVVTKSAPTCALPTLLSKAAWIRLAHVPAGVSLTVDANKGAARVGTIAIAGTLVTVSQAAVTVTPPVKPVVTVVVGDADASEAGLNQGTFIISRTGKLDLMAVNFILTGTAVEYGDYQTIGNTIRMKAGVASVTVRVIPKRDVRVDPNETVILTLLVRPLYDVGTPKTATLVIR